MRDNGERETPPMREKDRGETLDSKSTLHLMNMAKHWQHKRRNLRRNNNKILSYSTPTPNTFNNAIQSQAKQQGLNRTDICNLTNKTATYDAGEIMRGPNKRTQVSKGRTSSMDAVRPDIDIAVPIVKEDYGASATAPNKHADALHIEATSTNNKVIYTVYDNIGKEMIVLFKN